MRIGHLLLTLALTAPQLAAADGVRISIGARVLNRCSAKVAPDIALHCAVPQGATQTYRARSVDGMQVTVLF